MPIDDFLNAAPAPPLAPADLGVPDLPQAPQAPMMPQSQQPHGILQMLMHAAPGILAGSMGPGAGTGMAQGMVLGHQEQQRQQQQEFENQQRTYALQEHAYQQQAAQHDAMLRQRDAVLQQNLTALRSQVKELPDKDAYDRQVEAYANGLQNMGYRVDANRLRTMVPYVAPKAETLAVKAIERWQSLPNNKKLLTDHPEQAANAMIPFDRDGDGTPEQVRLQDLAMLAGMPLAQDANGVLFSNPGTTLEQKANADGILQQLIAKSKAERKQITPDLLIELQQQAIKMAKQADDKPKDAPRDRFNVQPITRPDGSQGLVRVNLDTGEVSSVNLPDGADSGKPTDTERLSSAYLTRTIASDKTALDFERQLAALGSQFDVKLPTLLQSEAGQRYKQAKDEFINASLRRESGAAIQPSEYARFDKIYFVQPGDTPATIRQKQEARARVVAGFRTTAGVMGKETPADKPTVAPPMPAAGPQMGERRIFNGQLGEWDGKGWKAVH